MTLEELSRIWSSKGTENGRLQEQIWDRRAEDYEAKSLPSCGTNPFLKYLCEKVPMNGELSLLDVGCGAGRFSLALAGRVREAAGIDVSGNMIAAARWRTYIHVNLEMIVVLCHWVEEMKSAKNL